MEFKTEVTDDELDKIADTYVETLQEITHFFNLGEVEIDEYEGDEGELILDLDGDNMASLIGRRGNTILSLQKMVTIISSNKLGYKYPVTVDVCGYRGKQRDKLEDYAFKMANKALSQSRKINLRPMTAYDRRIIHMALAQEKSVETFSEGVGRDRHIVIRPL